MPDWDELYQLLGPVAFDVPDDCNDEMVLKARTGVFIALDALATLSTREDDPEFESYDSFGGAFESMDWKAYPTVEPPDDDLDHIDEEID